MTNSLSDGRYWLDCSIDYIECFVHSGEVYTNRTDGQIISLGSVDECFDRLQPRDTFEKGLDDVKINYDGRLN